MPYKDPEKERQRQKIRRRSPKYKEYQREYQKKWIIKNSEKWKEIQKKSRDSPKRKRYDAIWQKTSPKAKLIRKKYNESEKGKMYKKEWTLNNPDKIKAKYARYYSSTKGIINHLKKNERKKFRIEPKNITFELINVVNQRDKNCVYCGKSLPDKPTNKNDVHYDHLNPFKPFSEINMVRCCGSCNHQKSNADVLQWCEFKGYKPSKIVYDLLKKNKNS
ncbi:MAG TPA: HNH endonuclease signature motif containing protein [Candidatus Nanoarchaeia archaeon]|nr:HNH endonuclease signature motif containing protein [Candidatus Nanoarchaeia archaeon]